MNKNPIEAWFSGAPAGEFTEPSQCKARADKFARTIRRRNFFEYAAGGLVSIVFGATAIGAFWEGEAMIGASALLTILGVAVILRELYRRASHQEQHPEDACLVHLQKQYRRQYDALRAVPLWYLGPLVPGMVAFYAAVTIKLAEKTGWLVALEGITRPVLITIGVFAAVALANWYAARAIKKQLNALDALA